MFDAGTFNFEPPLPVVMNNISLPRQNLSCPQFCQINAYLAKVLATVFQSVKPEQAEYQVVRPLCWCVALLIDSGRH